MMLKQSLFYRYINQRLKELYEKEMEQYQEELGEMGLAIAYVGNDE